MIDALSTKSTKSLRDQIQALPQELFDEIYNFTFTVPTGKYIRVTFPSILQVNRNHREALGKQYYWHNIFVAAHIEEAEGWFTALDCVQKRMLSPSFTAWYDFYVNGTDRYHNFRTKKRIIIVDNAASVDGRAIVRIPRWQQSL